MISKKNDQDLMQFNEQREAKGLPPMSRREFFKWAATSIGAAGALSMPWLFGCGKPTCVGACGSYYKRTLNDSRAITDVDPNIELDDYSGPFIPNLRHSYFSRKQIAWMLIMAHTYHYEIQKAYRAYIEEEYGYDGILKTEKSIWGDTIAKKMQPYYSESLNITGKDIEAYMKQWQVDLNSLPGDNYEVIFEMPDKYQGIVTYHRCPLVAEYEAAGMADKLTDICQNRCVNTIKKGAKLYNSDIELNVLALPPRQSANNVCCRFQLYYKGNGIPPIADTSLEIDPAQKDMRGERVVDSSIELKDYSGPFRPNLRLTDFSRKQLANLFLTQHQYDLGMMQGYEQWCLEKTLDMSKRAEISYAVWSNHLYKAARDIHAKYMNTTGQGIDGFLKAIQVDITSQPPNFDQTFEMPSADRGLMTYNKCVAVTQMETLGLDKAFIEEICALDPASIGKSTKIYSPNMELNILKLPPRTYRDEVCCKWEFYYV
jgi:hypothetical protein